MKYILTLSLMVFIGNFCGAQHTGPITVKENFWKGTVYLQNENYISKADVRLQLLSDKSLYDQFNAGNSAQVWGSVFGGIGGFLIGYPLGQSLGGGDPNWTLAIYGGAATILGAVIYGSGKKKIITAINSYNSGLTFMEAPDNRYRHTASYQLSPGYFVVNF